MCNLILFHAVIAMSLAFLEIEGGSRDSETESTKTVYTATVMHKHHAFGSLC